MYFCVKLIEMKKRSTIIFLLLCLTIISNAQKGLHLGITTAINSSWIINQNNYGTLSGFSDPIVRQSELAYKYKLGYQVGLACTYNFTHHVGLMTELLFNKAGQDYEDNMQEGKLRINVKRFVNLSYFQIPISFKYTTLKGNRVKYYFHVGPQVGCLLSSDEKVYIDGALKADSTGISANRKFSKLDFGLQLGTGVEVFLSKHLYLGIGFNSYLGLVDISGKEIKGLDWFSKNDINYQRSKNFRGGLVISLNYAFQNKTYISKSKTKKLG